MRLIELCPRWLGSPSPLVDRIVGVGFECPHCRVQRLNVYFELPVGFGSWGIDWRVWQRTGTTFETLSLFPSLDFRSTGHWHGQIINGEVITTPDSPRPVQR